MERYDKIEYDFDNSSCRQVSTDKDGFITSQQYIMGENAAAGEQDNQSQAENTEESISTKNKALPTELLTICQLVLCIIIAVAAYVIKNIGGDLYKNVREYYYTNLNNSIIIDMEKDTNDTAIKAILNDISSK